MPQYVVAGEEGSNEGVDTIELLCDNAGYKNAGPGLSCLMEGSNKSKGRAKNTNSDIGQKIPCTTDRQKWGEKKEEYNTRPIGGKKPTSKETKGEEETTWWFRTRSIVHRVDTGSYKRTCAHNRSEVRDTGYTCGRRS